MAARVTEVAEDTFQLSVATPEVDFAVNHYLVLGEEPLLFHAGMTHHFGDNLAALSTVVDPRSLRWIAFGHVEADECGALNHWLDAAPGAQAVQGQVGCLVSLGDLASRPPRALADGEVLDTGGHRLRWLDTPHVPHGWDAGLLFDEATGTLFCGDLFARFGDQPATTEQDLAEVAIAGERAEGYGSWSRGPDTLDRLRALAELGPSRLAPMHAPVWEGDGAEPLTALADDLSAFTAASG
jgi:flavorubredoxin